MRNELDFCIEAGPVIWDSIVSSEQSNKSTKVGSAKQKRANLNFFHYMYIKFNETLSALSTGGKKFRYTLTSWFVFVCPSCNEVSVSQSWPTSKTIYIYFVTKPTYPQIHIVTTTIRSTYISDHTAYIHPPSVCLQIIFFFRITFKQSVVIIIIITTSWRRTLEKHKKKKRKRWKGNFLSNWCCVSSIIWR